MKHALELMTLTAGLFAATAGLALTPSTVPAGATGQCKDGSYSSSANKTGACSGHKGIKDWYIHAEPAPVAKSATAATQGAPGQVWVNNGSGIYHCAGSSYFGKTSRGQYMTEAAAKAAGKHPDHGKGCTS